MITVTPTQDGNFDLEVTLRQPSVYLDLDSLADIAGNAERKRRLLGSFEMSGTLLFSWTHAMDVSGPQGGSLDRIRDLLAGIGENWIPLEINPWKVDRKESGAEPCSGTPCVSESLLYNYYPHIHGGVLGLATVVDLIHADREAVQAELLRLKTAADEMVQGWRVQFLAGRCLDEICPSICDARRPMASVLRDLERLVTREARGYTWMPNDGVDFMHAAVAAGCADFLVLDKQWKRRVLAVAPPRAYRWVYYRAELDEFLEAFEHCVIAG